MDTAGCYLAKQGIHFLQSNLKSVNCVDIQGTTQHVSMYVCATFKWKHLTKPRPSSIRAQLCWLTRLASERGTAGWSTPRHNVLVLDRSGSPIANRGRLVACDVSRSVSMTSPICQRRKFAEQKGHMRLTGPLQALRDYAEGDPAVRGGSRAAVHADAVRWDDLEMDKQVDRDRLDLIWGGIPRRHIELAVRRVLDLLSSVRG